MTDDDTLRVTLDDGPVDQTGSVEKERPGVASQIVRSILLAGMIVWASWLIVGWVFDQLGDAFFG